MVPPRIYADFQNLDDLNRIRLNTVGTREDLDRAGLELRDGLKIIIYTDDADDEGNADELMVEGCVTYNSVDQCWVAAVDWNRLTHASEHSAAQAR